VPILVFDFGAMKCETVVPKFLWISKPKSELALLIVSLNPLHKTLHTDNEAM